MKEFRKTNTVTQNLMSFTGFKSMLIFSELVKEPKSYDQLQDVIAKNEILRENLSVDALRVYINSLKAVGCDIQKVNVDGQKKYSIVSHPYMLKFSDEQIQSIIKVFKIVSQNIEVNDLLLLRNFFSKIAPYIENSELKEKLSGLYPLNNIDENLIKNNNDSMSSVVLLNACEKFTSLTENDEYLYDESKEVKEDVYAINKLLELVPYNAEELADEELKEDSPFVFTSLDFTTNVEKVRTLLKSNNQTLILKSVEILKELQKLTPEDKNIALENTSNSDIKNIILAIN